MNYNTEIDNYLDDMFTKKNSRAETETLLQLQNVSDTAYAIDLHLAAAKALQRFKVMEQVHLIHSEFVRKPRGLVKIITIAMRVAAFVLLAVGGWFFYTYSTTNSASLYQKIYQPYHVNTDRGVEDALTHNMVNEFKAGNYAAVVKSYESLPVSNNREKFLAGYASHQLGQYETSINLFNLILENNRLNNSRLYNDESEFYLALSYLKTNNVKSAFPFFRKIGQSPNHTFHERVNSWTLTRLRWLQ